MVICVRYTKNLTVFERFLGFIDVSESQNATSLSSAILTFLEKFKLSHVPIIAQSYDGANVMSGDHGGVQTIIREKYPYAIYTHCMAHKTNLIVMDICKLVKVILILLFYSGFYYFQIVNNLCVLGCQIII